MPYRPPPELLEGFPQAVRTKPKTDYGGGKRRRWKGDDGTIYEWDYQHGTVEVYDRRGIHKGEADPKTGAMTGGPTPDRKVEP